MSPSKTALLLNPPFRAEHIGSLIRPAPLYAKREAFAEKKCTPEELSVAEDEAIRNVVKKQTEVGLRTITDGEFRRLRVFSLAVVHSNCAPREYFFEGVFDKLEGMTFVPNRMRMLPFSVNNGC